MEKQSAKEQMTPLLGKEFFLNLGKVKKKKKMR
jgi:hypothetical protein